MQDLWNIIELILGSTIIFLMVVGLGYWILKNKFSKKEIKDGREKREAVKETRKVP